MHEVSIALSIIDGVSEQALASNARSVAAVHVRIGVMSGIQKDALSFAWELVADGTIAQGARLVIEEVPAGIDCPECGYAGPPAPPLACPRCAEICCPLVRGREMDVVAMEVEDDAAFDRRSTIDTQEEQHARA
ncbi:MAG TPA: hydrogenase maturation nickel metallochaperone HypA [Candidatus Baltobacteraceae bacterium]|jgi:hydrogenase nickel incorporation protein HypA/HybF